MSPNLQKQQPFAGAERLDVSPGKATHEYFADGLHQVGRRCGV